jgi:PAP2 superfamily
MRPGIRELAIVGGFTLAYERLQALSRQDAAEAVGRARELAALQAGWPIPTEGAVQHMAKGLPLQAMAYSYLSLHFIGTTLLLLTLWHIRRPAYFWIRNALMVSMSVALAIQMAWPTAPPRLTPGSGLFDAVTTRSPMPLEGGHLDGLYAPFNALPSMHVGTALLVAAVIAAYFRTRLRWLALAYPVWVTLTVVATGNHWYLDALAGAGVAAIGAALTAPPTVRFVRRHAPMPPGRGRRSAEMR